MKRLKIILIGLLVVFSNQLLLSSQVLGQVKVSGTVKQENGKPLPGASVYLVGSLTGATSDEEGRFQFEVNEKGAHTLAASFLGFLPFEKKITLTARPSGLTSYCSQIRR